MAQMIDKAVQPVTDLDLVTALHRVLERSPEPLTPFKIRAALPADCRALGDAALEENLRRQTAANVLVQYPPYRSHQVRYWDRPMSVHVVGLIRGLLRDRPLAVSELRRRLPPYARSQVEVVLADQVAQGLLHCHPPLGQRAVPRYGLEPPDIRAALAPEWAALCDRLERQGFTRVQLRQAALELLQQEAGVAPAPPGCRRPDCSLHDEQPAARSIPAD
jgi:hypothetical protein